MLYSCILIIPPSSNGAKERLRLARPPRARAAGKGWYGGCFKVFFWTQKCTGGGEKKDHARTAPLFPHHEVRSGACSAQSCAAICLSIHSPCRARKARHNPLHRCLRTFAADVLGPPASRAPHEACPAADDRVLCAGVPSIMSENSAPNSLVGGETTSFTTSGGNPVRRLATGIWPLGSRSAKARLRSWTRDWGRVLAVNGDSRRARGGRSTKVRVSNHRPFMHTRALACSNDAVEPHVLTPFFEPTPGPAHISPSNHH